MALYFECRINKKALLQTVTLAILPTGFIMNFEIKNIFNLNLIE